MTGPAFPGYRARRFAVPSRNLLLAGVSATALAMGLATPARAGQPPLFSQQWFAARAQGGTTTTTASASGSAGGSSAAASQSIADLARTSAAIKAAQSFQAQAAAARTAGTVPNGLTAGGLAVAAGALQGGTLAPSNTLWIGAKLPTQTLTPAGTTVTVTQTSPQALLTWDSFNVGANTTLAFDQSKYGGAAAYQWVALNKVPGSVAPSQILGKVTAPGKVYVINPNGVIFGAGSQVNVNSLIASAADLPVSITPGSNGGDSTVAFSIYGAANGSDFTAAFKAAAASSSISVEVGASIVTSAPASATTGGGYVMLFGGTVRNAGAISTPQGQTVLASGTDFVLRPGYSSSGNQTATVIGSQVATVGTGTVAENTGIITATDGDVTLVGHNVAQSGVALSSTSVNKRGTIHLLSDTGDSTATITLSSGSVTTVLPDASQDTALNSQRTQLIAQSASLNALRLAAPSASNPQVNNVGTLSDRLDLSRVEITTGGSVRFASGSVTMAQGGQIAVQAAGRAQADSSAVLDVSGQLNVTLPMSSNQIAVSVQSFEQRDAPVNRLTGNLSSSTVYLDARDLVLVPASARYATDRYYSGGGLLEVSGYLNTTGHTIGEWTSVGGTITLAANEVVAQNNATFNISGGSLSYQGGTLKTSYLVGPTGQLFDANTAAATVKYSGVYKGQVVTQPKWNISETYTNPLIAPASTYEPGYTVGRNAGSLILSTPTAVFEGSIVAGVSNGPFQNKAQPASITDGYAATQTMVAVPGTFALGQYAATGLSGTYPVSVLFSNTAPALADSLTLSTPMPADRAQTAFLSSAALNAAGLGGLVVTTSGSIQVADPITLAPGGVVKLVAQTVDLGAGITARAGNILATNVVTLPNGPTALGGSQGQVTLRAGATLDVRGVWTNALTTPRDMTGAAYINGGSVTLDSSAGLTVAAGSLIDASAGAIMLPGGSSGGKGGSVALVGIDPTYAQAGDSAVVSILGVTRAYGVTGSGTLKVVAQNVEIGAALTTAATGTLWLTPDLFRQGFATYDVTGVQSLTVDDGTAIAAVAPSFRFTPSSGNLPTGSEPSSALELWLPPLFVFDPQRATTTQRSGVSLYLRAAVNGGSAAARGGALRVGDGARITVDPGQKVTLEGYDQVTVNGTVSAPGGSIAVVNLRQELLALAQAQNYVDGLSVWLGATSRLDAAGRAYTSTDLSGRPFGVVYAGGTITLGAYGGDAHDGAGSVVSTDAQVILRPGAQLDVSGAAAWIDPAAGRASVAEAVAGGGTAALVASNGGTLALSSYTGIYNDATMRALAGGAGAAGGTLALTLETPLFSANAPTTPAAKLLRTRAILVSQDTTSDVGTAALAPGQATPAELFDQARLSQAQLTAGGFANVSLFSRDVIAFDGNVRLSVAGSVQFLQGIVAETDPTASASVAARYVLLSGYTVHTADATLQGVTVTGANWKPNSADTSARLTVDAALIDVANDLRFGVQGVIATGTDSQTGAVQTVNVAYPGFASIALNSAGDVRFGTSTLITPGDLSFTAAQLYPTTLASASVYAGVNYYLPDQQVVQADGQTVEVKRNIYAPGHAITVAWNGNAAPAPYSAGGSLQLVAPTVEQGGIVRAPEGQITLGAVITGPVGSPVDQTSYTGLVELRPGSITSVSAAGQSIPFGGSADGQTYTYAGQSVSALQPAVTIQAQSVQSDSGATLDLSGGGTLTGAVFQTGRGGSSDILLQPMLNFTGTSLSSTTLATRPVYAIIPGFSSAFAPVTPVDQSSSYAGSVPSVGDQITLAAGADGLPAGTYTLLPSYYALQPGAFRVEIDTTARAALTGATALPGGSTLVAGYRGNAAAGTQAALAVPVTLSPAGVVRTYAQYVETSYAAFQVAIAAQTGAPRAAIPADAKQLTLIYPGTLLSPSTVIDPNASLRPALIYDGTSLFSAAAGGFGGSVQVEGPKGASSNPNFEVVGAGATATVGYVSLSAQDLDALGAARLVIGGTASVTSSGGTPTVTFFGRSGSVVVRSGATLTAPEVFLTATTIGGLTGAVTVEGGATIETVTSGAVPYDSSNGYYYNAFGSTLVALSNGDLNFTPDNAASNVQGPITLAAKAVLAVGGSLTFATTQGLNLDPDSQFGAKYLSLNVASVNIVGAGVTGSGKKVTLPPGLVLSQDVLGRLLQGNTAIGAPSLARFSLTATQSMNLFGSVSLSTGSATGGLQQFVLNTPAIYGWSSSAAGGSQDVATISAGSGTLVWNGLLTSVPAGAQTVAGSQAPGGYAVTGLASGTGKLVLSGARVVLGYPAGSQVNNQVSLDRLALGFGTVELSASREIRGNNRGSLSVYATQAKYGQPGTGGDLVLDAPLLTAQAGALTRLTAGGNILFTGAGTADPSTAGLGAEIDLTAATVTLNSTVALPSGRLLATARSGITLGAAGTLALGGRTTTFFDQSSDSAGGSVVLSAATGDIRQDAASSIDVSARRAAAGSVSVTAAAGTVALAGSILGGAASGEPSGSIDVRANVLTDFAGLNLALTKGGVTGSRAFEIATGDLTVGNELVASHVSLSVDGGSLTLTGTIQASGATPGTVDLSAGNGLTLGAAALIDAHGTVLRTDSYGAAIDAENTPKVTLSTVGGTLTLLGGAGIDARSADGVARGRIVLNAPRVGSDDIAIAATGSLSIQGVWTGTADPAGSVAVYGWRSYTIAPDAGGVAQVTQSVLDGIDSADTQGFMTAAAGNAGLQARLQPLIAAAKDAFHLRPGVQLVSGASSGSILVNGDLNLANQRYGAGGKEPGALVLRAGGNLTINGSITDGFAAPADGATAATRNPDDAGWVLLAGGEPFGADVVLPARLPRNIVLDAGTTFTTSNAVALNYAITIAATTLNQGVALPAAVKLADSGDPTQTGYVIPAGGWVATAPIRNENGKVVYRAGAVIPAGKVLKSGWTLDAGSVLPFQVNVPDGTVWPAGASLQAFANSTVTLNSPKTLTGGAFIPSGTTIVFPVNRRTGVAPTQVDLRAAVDGVQGQIWAIAPMLPAGSMSWSIGLVSGANTAAADRFAVRPRAALGKGGNVVLSDLHYSTPSAAQVGYTETPSFSVIRTGTGDLRIASGGDFTEYSLYGIYTAGTQTANVDPAFTQPQAQIAAGQTFPTTTDANSNTIPSPYEAFVVNYKAYYPTGGGDVSLAAQGGVYGDVYGNTLGRIPASDWVGNWLWRQGTGTTSGVTPQPAAWWINFGNYVVPLLSGALGSAPALTGFTGIGTLGGGNLTVIAGGDAGVTVGRDSAQRSQGLDLAVASTGRVTGVTLTGGEVTGGTLAQTGGGDLTLIVGGVLNGLDTGVQSVNYDGLNGTLTDLRGAATVRASQIGRIVYQYGTPDPVDVRPLDPYVPTVALEQGGPIVVPGDATFSLSALRDVVLGGAGDAGRLPLQNLQGFDIPGSPSQSNGGITAFSLWTPRSAIDIASFGGNATPTSQPLFPSLASATSNDMPTDSRFLFPPTLSVTVDSGNIYYGTLKTSATMAYSLELAPAPLGQLQLLAAGSIYASGYSLDISGAAANTNLSGGTQAGALPNPFSPAFSTTNGLFGNQFVGAAGPYSLFAFGADTPTGDLHAGDAAPARIYAVSGDIVDLRFGEILNFSASSGITPSTWYLAGKPAWIMAGNDIVSAGQRPLLDPGNPSVGSTVFGNEQNQGNTAVSNAVTSGNLLLNNSSVDSSVGLLSMVSAGRDILNSYFYIAGSGQLEVDAGRNLNQQNVGTFKSIGPLYDVGTANRDGGAGIAVTVGTGTAGIDAANFASLYFNPANVADPDFALTAPQNRGKVAVSYAADLLAWLKADFAYGGDAAGALAYFDTLTPTQQAPIVRKAFFKELVASGREAADPTSRRYHNYVRGTEAIYALLPWTPAPDAGTDPNYASDRLAYASVVPASVVAATAAGTGLSYAGSLTMYSGNSVGSTGTIFVTDAGISTQFGGDIQVIAPGGSVQLGLAGGVQPGAGTGLITFGTGDVQSFARGSIILGQSRVFTTYGGSIQLWSGTGDVNAGIGTKTSVLYQPPIITYDGLGNLTLAPTAPTNGAGIATISSIPGVPAGDVDLAAPQGTIDAGEAGIRVSGNLTLAALAVSNANNLSVGGKTVGAPTVAVSNVGALSAASAATGAANSAAAGAADEQRRKRAQAEASVIVVEVVGLGE